MARYTVAPHVERVQGGNERDGGRVPVPEDPGDGLHYARGQVHVLITLGSPKSFPADLFRLSSTAFRKSPHNTCNEKRTRHLEFVQLKKSGF